MLEILDDIIEMGVKAVTFSGGGDPKIKMVLQYLQADGEHCGFV